MSESESAPSQQRVVRRITGLWLVVLSITFAAVGIFVALQTARSTTERLMAQVDAHAAWVARQARDAFNRELRAATDRLQFTILLRGPNAARRTTVAERLPGWIDGAFLWRGNGVETLLLPSVPTEILSDMIESRLSAYAASVPDPAMPSSAASDRRTRLYHDRISGRPVVLAVTPVGDAEITPVLLGININLDKLRTEFVEPLLPPDGVLELVDSEKRDPQHSQPLYLAMKYWAIQTSPSFVAEQRRAAIGQTVSYSALMLLALVTLLVAMRFVVLVARRETSLAELKSNFVADVSHELKTPLSLIRMFAETLESGRVADDAKRNEYYRTIVRESTRLTNLINNILDFARIDAGKKQYILDPIDIGDVVRETYTAYADQLEYHGFEHELKIEPGLPKVAADADAIAQVLLNLMSNAIKYSDQDKYLQVDAAADTRRNKNGVLLSVQDRGIGIKPEDRARVLEGFFRAEDGRVRQKGGAGLGLALVKHIVETHGGELTVESRLVRGSTFRVFLPAAEEDVLDRSGDQAEAGRAVAEDSPSRPGEE